MPDLDFTAAIESAAKVLAYEAEQDSHDEPVPWEAATENYKTIFRLLAREVLTAAAPLIAARARASGFAEAVAMLRDDDRYHHWWSGLPPQDPAYGYWQAPARKHLADYLETIKLVKHIRRVNEVAKRCGDYSMAVSEYRDEAWKERDRLRERIRNVREMAEAAEIAISRGCLCRCGCVPGGHCEKHDFDCWKPMGWSLDPAAVLAALDGEDEEQA